MKKLFAILFTIISFSSFAQLPSNNPSFIVSQQVGLETVEFTFKPISSENPLETFLGENDTYYPGGRTYFIIRLSDDIYFQDMLVEKGNYVGGFSGTLENLTLIIEPEEIDNSKKKDEETESIKIPLELLGEFNCEIQGQSFMILPYQGYVNNASVIFSFGSSSYLLNMNISGEKLFAQLKKELENKDGRYYKQYFLAAKYGIEAGIVNDVLFDWIKYAEKDNTNWEVKWIKALALGKIGKYRPAIEEANTAINLLTNNKSLDQLQQDQTTNDIKDYISGWEKNLR